jgi:hypothetical protein
VPSSNKRAARSGARFDGAATVLAAAFTGGVFLDGWAHTHGRVDDTFFTPWHAVLYSGFLAMAVLLVGRAAWGVAREGVAWRRAMLVRGRAVRRGLAPRARLRGGRRRAHEPRARRGLAPALAPLVRAAPRQPDSCSGSE